MQQNKAIIIGAGIAGIASAIRLAAQGFEVQVFEKNNYAGGKLSAFKNGEYQFDAGPSLFTQPENICELFALCGENMDTYFQYNKLDETCKYFYENDIIINAFADKDAFANELHTKVGIERDLVKSYLIEAENMYENIGTIFLNNSIQKLSFFKKNFFGALKALRAKYLFQSLHSFNQKKFRTEKTVQLFDRFATYNGSNPYTAPAMLSLISHVEFNQGSFYPKGGMISITKALYNLALKKGVRFSFNSAVEKIIVSDSKVSGIVVNNENIYSDIVVSNMDVYFTYKNLLNNLRKATSLLKQERSSSAIVFYWGIKKCFSQLQLHNIFFSKDYESEFTHIFKLKQLYNDPTIYINITSKCEPGIHAPLGKENWFVMINVPANYGQDWKLFVANARRFVIEKINLILKTDIESYIETEDVLDPEAIEEKTLSFMGSIYGISSNSRAAAFLRHPNFSKDIKGLYFVGGSVHPGGGIPLCLKSAKIMSAIVVDDMKQKKLIIEAE